MSYTDETEMPFGKYKGQKLANVPASYLLWYYDNPGFKDASLMAYIEANKMCIMQEADLEKIKKNKV